MSRGLEQELTLTTKQAAEFLHIKENTLRKWIMSGKGPAYSRIGEGRGRILYRLPVLLKYLESTERGGGNNVQTA